MTNRRKRRFRRRPRIFTQVHPVSEGFVVRHQVEGRSSFYIGSDKLWVRQSANATPFSTREQADEQLKTENETDRRNHNGTNHNHD